MEMRLRVRKEHDNEVVALVRMDEVVASALIYLMGDAMEDVQGFGEGAGALLGTCQVYSGYG